MLNYVKLYLLIFFRVTLGKMIVTINSPPPVPSKQSSNPIGVSLFVIMIYRYYIMWFHKLKYIV